MRITLLIVLGISFVVSVILCQLLLWQLVRLDAIARKIARPGLVSWLASSNQNMIGLFAYITLRRQHAIIAELDQPAERQHLKIRLTTSFVVMFSLFICLMGILFLWQ
ncbi:hypothetical protein [Loigolactobacillus zhaoyuanensis]|uniref:hypothetical protein n=1 Tax=Loigolactobacillus zhaoyuanensis TaxID=2486017 RepID=UPI000F73F5D9|nr:hypothetical protein [Loigolactobacillus zhaoyuanensis]